MVQAIVVGVHPSSFPCAGGHASQDKDLDRVTNLNLLQFVLVGEGRKWWWYNCKNIGEAPKVLQEQEGAAMFILAYTLPVIPAKLVRKIQKGEFVDMAELLKDDTEAERRVASYG